MARRNNNKNNNKKEKRTDNPRAGRRSSISSQGSNVSYVSVESSGEVEKSFRIEQDADQRSQWHTGTQHWPPQGTIQQHEVIHDEASSPAINTSINTLGPLVRAGALTQQQVNDFARATGRVPSSSPLTFPIRDNNTGRPLGGVWLEPTTEGYQLAQRMTGNPGNNSNDINNYHAHNNNMLGRGLPVGLGASAGSEKVKYSKHRRTRVHHRREPTPQALMLYSNNKNNNNENEEKNETNIAKATNNNQKNNDDHTPTTSRRQPKTPRTPSTPKTPSTNRGRDNRDSGYGYGRGRGRGPSPVGRQYQRQSRSANERQFRIDEEEDEVELEDDDDSEVENTTSQADHQADGSWQPRVGDDRGGDGSEDEEKEEEEEEDEDEEEEQEKDEAALDPAAHRECLLDTMVAITDSLMAAHQDLKALEVGSGRHSEENHGHHSDARQLEMRRAALNRRLSRVALILLHRINEPRLELMPNARRDAYNGAIDRLYNICHTFGEARWNDAGDNFQSLSVSLMPV